MADIFISYAHEDRERTIPLAAALERAGFSVWWDREIRGGDDFDLVIETALEEATCVIVCWSAVSRLSRYVRDEARDAMERNSLVPIFLESVKPPLGFRSLHTEDFKDWRGDEADECWQRLVLQTEALKSAAAVQSAKQSAPETTNEQPVPLELKSDHGVGVVAVSSTGFNAGAAFLGSTLPLLALAYFLGSGPQLGIMGLTFTLALLAFLLMRQADHDLHPHMKALASRWLLPVEGKAQVNTPEAFLRLFEAVFGRKHWSWRCLWRSSIASTLGLVVMLVVFDSYVIGANISDLKNSIISIAFSIMFIAIPANIVGDFFSLWETRLLLKIAAHRPFILPLLILLDALLTLFIWFAGILISFFAIEMVPSDVPLWKVNMRILGILAFEPESLSNFFTQYSQRPDLLAGGIVYGATLATSFITSIWLWLVVVVTPVLRALMWSRSSGLTVLGRLVNTADKPFTAFGLLTAMLIMATGSLIWGVSFFLVLRLRPLPSFAPPGQG